MLGAKWQSIVEVLPPSKRRRHTLEKGAGFTWRASAPSLERFGPLPRRSTHSIPLRLGSVFRVVGTGLNMALVDMVGSTYKIAARVN